MAKLRKQQRLFAEEYIKDLHGEKSAIRAGYSKKSARVQASQLLTRPNIKAYIEELRERATSENILTSIQIKEMLSARAQESLDQIGLKAIDILNRMQGEYVDKSEIKVDGEVKFASLGDYYKSLK